MKLSETQVRNAKPKDKPYKLTDGDGMYLFVHPNGGRYWRVKYRVANKEKTLSLGTYPEIGLGKARELRFDARKQMAAGVDPGAIKQQAKTKQEIEHKNTFGKIAREWIDNRSNAWTSRYAGIVYKRLESDVFPFFEDRPIDAITAPELLELARKIEARGAHDLAHRVVQVCGQIFQYAIVTGRATRNISVDIRGALKPTKKKHHPHLSAADLPQFISKIDDCGDKQTVLAMKLLMLTFVRTVELRGAEWSEISFDKAEWRIPAERMKMRQPHIVPLSKQSLEILQELHALSGGQKFVFPNSVNPHKCMSENTILYAIYRMGYRSRATGHGFRSTASTILNEQGFRADVIERQLAHTEGNKVRASYNHAQYLPERRQMMQEWADYLEGI